MLRHISRSFAPVAGPCPITSQPVVANMKRMFSSKETESSQPMQAASPDKPSDSTATEAVQPKPSQLPEAVSGTATTMRSFRDVFAPEAAGADTPAEASVPDFEFAVAQQGELEQLQAPGSKQREATAGEKLISPEYGYAAISGSTPSKRDRGSLLATHPKLHPQRMFMPGDIYEPEDLNPFHKSDGQRVRRGGRIMPSVQEVAMYKDFRNVAFLEKFLSPAGRLLPRKVTKLPPGLHSSVMREVKLARAMGFIAGETLLHKSHLRRVREADARMQAHKQQGSS